MLQEMQQFMSSIHASMMEVRFDEQLLASVFVPLVINTRLGGTRGGVLYS